MFRLSILIFLVFISCTEKPALNLSEENIIPQPVSIQETNSSFKIKNKTSIYIQSAQEELESIGTYMASSLSEATGLNIQVKTTKKTPRSGNLYLCIQKDSLLGDEGYELTITEKLVKISANKPAGIFRGVQTIRQLLPVKNKKIEEQNNSLFLATGMIRDFPEYEYRGVMLDVSRHFFGVDDVKKYIDLMAYYKLNFLHLHLSDDQGWRIEIKSWPQLTTIGASTEVGGGEGGFYTQEEYKEIVSYASKHFVTIIPEIDMPGHTNAALASYAKLNCDGKATELYTGTKVGFSTLCTHKEITYQFIDDVIGELAAITPGEYIHIGGDESHVTPLKDYIPFINRVQKIVKSHGKKLIGWDEIAHANLEENTTVQFWARAENAVKGIKQGAKVIMSPARKAYLDMQYDSTTTIGLHWAAYVEVDEAYDWNPDTFVPEIKKSDILGIEAPLWSETVTCMDEIEYLTFPRLIGHAEIGWSPASLRNWDTYKLRLANHGPRLEEMDVNFYRSVKVPWINLKEND